MGSATCDNIRKRPPSAPVTGMLQRRGSGSVAAAQAPAIVGQALVTSGRPLESATRSDMERRFGHDFSRVRVHTDDKAAESAQAMNAAAYTVGRDVVFGTGRYAPATNEGRRLLAHELTHVIQQGQKQGSSGELKRSARSDQLEREARRVSRVAVGDSASRPAASVLGSSPVMVQMQKLERRVPLKDELVQQYIDKALEEAGGNPSVAHSILYGWRNRSENCGDESLAAAEHYMFARAEVAGGESPAAQKVNTLLYYLVKHVYAPKTGVCPATPPSLDQMDWATKGVEDGKSDRIAAEEKAEKERAELRAINQAVLASEQLQIIRTDAADSTINLRTTEPHFEVGPLPKRHSLQFRWVVARGEERYLMWGPKGSVFHYGAQSHALIRTASRNLLIEQGIREATVRCRVTADGCKDRLLELPVNFTW